MARADVIALIAEDPRSHGVYDNPNTTERTVFCTVRSVGMSETYTARSQGLAPELRFELAVPEEYEGEKLCRYNDLLYEIIRVYNAGQKVELTVQRSNAYV